MAQKAIEEAFKAVGKLPGFTASIVVTAILAASVAATASLAPACAKAGADSLSPEQYAFCVTTGTDPISCPNVFANPKLQDCCGRLNNLSQPFDVLCNSSTPSNAATGNASTGDCLCSLQQILEDPFKSRLLRKSEKLTDETTWWAIWASLWILIAVGVMSDAAVAFVEGQGKVVVVHCCKNYGHRAVFDGSQLSATVACWICCPARRRTWCLGCDAVLVFVSNAITMAFALGVAYAIGFQLRDGSRDTHVHGFSDDALWVTGITAAVTLLARAALMLCVTLRAPEEAAKDLDAEDMELEATAPSLYGTNLLYAAATSTQHFLEAVATGENDAIVSFANNLPGGELDNNGQLKVFKLWRLAAETLGKDPPGPAAAADKALVQFFRKPRKPEQARVFMTAAIQPAGVDARHRIARVQCEQLRELGQWLEAHGIATESDAGAQLKALL